MALTSDRLVFIPFEAKDFGNYFKLYSNEKVMEMITGRPLTEKEAREKFSNMLETNKLYPEIGWYSIQRKEDREFIGLGKIVMTTEHEAEIGYALLPGFWGKGYASEISEKLINHSRSIEDIHSLIAIIDPENKASKRILEKGNFKLEVVCEIDNLPAEIYRLKLWSGIPY